MLPEIRKYPAHPPTRTFFQGNAITGRLPSPTSEDVGPLPVTSGEDVVSFPPSLLRSESSSSASAIDNQPRIWRALSGDTMELDGRTFRLAGVTCPDPDTEDGRTAKALLNTFLRSGRIACRVTDTEQVSCTKEDRDFATGMLASGLCE